jgi:hypothetical protein
LLHERIQADASAGVPSNVQNLFYWFSFDAMGDFVLSKSFNMLSDRRWHPFVASLQNALSLLGPFSPTPWLLHVGLKLAPRIMAVRAWFNVNVWCHSQMSERLDGGLPKHAKPDLTHYLMEQKDQIIDEDNVRWMKGDSMLAIVAGRYDFSVANPGLS